MDSPTARRSRVFYALAGAAALLSALAACAGPGGIPQAAAVGPKDDPLAPVNRKIFAVNQVIDRLVLRPIAEIYLHVLPQPVRGSIHDALANARQPVIMLNEVLQGDPHRLGISLRRFAVNTTVGMAGLVDVATRWGVPQAKADFGETLYTWGVSSGPYLVLPVLGPTNPRDALGMAVDSYIDPMTFLANAKGLQNLETTELVTHGIDERARAMPTLDALQKNSLDFYAELRSLSQQHRAAELNPKAPQTPSNFYDVSGGSAPAAAPQPARKDPAR